MADMQAASASRQKEPLISDQMIKKITIWVTLIAVATIALNFLGHLYSSQMMQGTHSDDITPVDVFIGPDHLRLPMNVIRFPEQRVTGETESINLYLLWPQMEGYSQSNRAQFNRISGDQNLIMVQLSQATMTLDMSGRLDPIYSRLFEGPTLQGPHGLELHKLKATSGYSDEVLLSEKGAGERPFAIRCILPSRPSEATGADCQRDVAAGTDLSVLYRYSSTMLKDWRAIDSAVQKYVADHLVPDVSGRTQRVSQ
ncbi:hypothetical protein [Rhizobium sp. L1K21]|uniref:hypothetical protein n=1 Tax=Rhizobium sp. L1K21 TaxID=2954933 RepID=UPI0020936AEA|nr:hypothetical protein [Rhizobium sp. L1K21]MCO6186118.1 hypothetical protein [Rhizobium sp. L1K21]